MALCWLALGWLALCWLVLGLLALVLVVMPQLEMLRWFSVKVVPLV